MRLSRLWDNRSLGIQPIEAGQAVAVAEFESRGRRHATRLSRKIAAVGIALIVGLWAVIIFASHIDGQTAIDRARAQGHNLSAAFASESTRMMDAISSAMELIAGRVREEWEHGQGTLDAERLTADIAAVARPVIRAGLIGPDGTMIFSTMPRAVADLNFKGRAEFDVHQKPGSPPLFIGHPIMETQGQPITLPVTRRVSAADGTFLGVLMFSLSPGHVTRLHQSVDLGRRGTLAIICPDGAIRARFSADRPDGLAGIGTSVMDGPFNPNLPPGGMKSYIRAGAVDNVVRLYTLRRLTDYDLFVSVGVDLDDVLASARNQKLLRIAVGAAVTLLIGMLTTLLIREIWRRTMREIELAREHGRLEEAHAQILRDRERLAVANRELIKTAERADAANQAKSQFLANMSHELRTPLHAIIGFSELIKEQAGRPGQGQGQAMPVAEYANDILSSGRHLLELINTVLDLSKVESGTATLTEIVVPIHDVVNASMISIRAQARARRIRIQVALPPDAPLVRVDLTKMRQVLINLLSNAVKFTPEEGSVSVAASRSADGGAVITVTDTGIGMSEAEMAVAMEPFGQVDSTLSRLADGTGLGLPLALRLMELHGGDLRLHSAKGHGTTVEVVIPACRVVANTVAAS